MIIPRVENLIFDKKNSKDEIWMLNYQNISLDHKIIKVFLKYQLKYPKKDFTLKVQQELLYIQIQIL